MGMNQTHMTTPGLFGPTAPSNLVLYNRRLLPSSTRPNPKQPDYILWRSKRWKMVMKVYGPVRAACPQRVLACLVEKGVEFEVVHVDLDSGEQKRPDFLLRQVRYFINHCLFYYSICACGRRGTLGSDMSCKY